MDRKARRRIAELETEVDIQTRRAARYKRAFEEEMSQGPIRREIIHEWHPWYGERSYPYPHWKYIPNMGTTADWTLTDNSSSQFLLSDSTSQNSGKGATIVKVVS